MLIDQCALNSALLHQFDKKCRVNVLAGVKQRNEVGLLSLSLQLHTEAENAPAARVREIGPLEAVLPGPRLTVEHSAQKSPFRR